MIVREEKDLKLFVSCVNGTVVKKFSSFYGFLLKFASILLKLSAAMSNIARRTRWSLWKLGERCDKVCMPLNCWEGWGERKERIREEPKQSENLWRVFGRS